MDRSDEPTNEPEDFQKEFDKLDPEEQRQLSDDAVRCGLDVYTELVARYPELGNLFPSAFRHYKHCLSALSEEGEQAEEEIIELIRKYVPPDEKLLTRLAKNQVIVSVRHSIAACFISGLQVDLNELALAADSSMTRGHMTLEGKATQLYEGRAKRLGRALAFLFGELNVLCPLHPEVEKYTKDVCERLCIDLVNIAVNQQTAHPTPQPLLFAALFQIISCAYHFEDEFPGVDFREEMRKVVRHVIANPEAAGL